MVDHKKQDEESIEEITSAFVKALIANKINDPKRYAELQKRIESLIEAEVKWRKFRKWDELLMSAWGPRLN